MLSEGWVSLGSYFRQGAPARTDTWFSLAESLQIKVPLFLDWNANTGCPKMLRKKEKFTKILSMCWISITSDVSSLSVYEFVF